MAAVRDIAALRRMLAGLEAGHLPGAADHFSPGEGASPMTGMPLARAALHEVRAPGGGDLPAAAGFTLGLALRAVRETEARPILWIRQDMAETELGRPDAAGLAALGLDPARFLLVRAPDVTEALRAAGDAMRCAGLGALVLECWGEPKSLDLTATRRLSLLAASSGVTGFLLRMTAGAGATAVASRWQVAAAASRPLGAAREVGAPGNPAFAVTLLRHRGEGRHMEDGTWNLEWDRETCSFRDLAALPRALVSVPAGRPAGTAAQGAGWQEVAAFRRAG